jgi:hypothetical protein
MFSFAFARLAFRCHKVRPVRPLDVGSFAGPLLFTLAACTAQGSSTTVTGPGSTSGAPVFPVAGDSSALIGPAKLTKLSD